MEDKPFHRVHPKTLNRARELRRDQTRTEKILWRELCGRRLAGLKFRRQYPVGPYIVDFFCANKKLVIEIDGDSHVEDPKREARRTKWLEKQGYRVIRFTNREVSRQMASVLDTIKEKCGLE